MRLERILLNLITNALKYSPEPSPVRIEARRAPAGIEVAVIDRGRGIDAEDVPHIFQRYYRTRRGRKGRGIGLGLYIARLLVEAHGGRIRAESEAGRGSAFHLTTRVEVAADAQDAGRPAGLRNESVLVAESNETARGILTRLLAQAGAQARDAEGGWVAVEELESGRAAGTPYWALVLDGTLPEMADEEFLADLRCRQERDGLRIVVLAPTGR